ncbi:MAG: response regulator, partial [Pirellulaceae bacterium]|nr:response regulator [Pirellulaceae bacterium]
TKHTIEQHDYLAMVKDSADALLRLLNDILDFSKIEAGKLELEEATFNLRECIGRTGQTLGLRAADDGLELHCRIDPDLPEYLVGDSVRLRQIIINLTGNAIKFTERGDVTIDVTEESRDQNCVTLHVMVKDTGIGIPPEQQERVFAAFEQADTSITRKFGGTGLGLAISSQLVSMMGGRIWLESEVGKGTTFHFTCQFDIGIATPTTTADDMDALTNLRVLIVDDNLTNQRILEEIMANWNMQAVSVESGEDALVSLRQARDAQRPFRFALLDCMMPVMDGFELAERIGSDSANADCAMVMISSGVHPGDSDRCRDLGVIRHMTKPVVQSELLETLLSDVGRRDADSSGHHGSSTDAVDERGSLKILLAEDGLINQRVAVGLLEARGHSVTVAENGKIAFDAVVEQRYDLVLMDIQMPVMDGLEATTAIRQHEKDLDQHTPIIAMTAAAMKGDREKCIQVGMDGYLSKPVNPEELSDLLRNYRPASTNGDATAESTENVIDWEFATSSIPGGSGVVKELAQLLQVECPKLLDQIREGIQAGDPIKVQRGAHTLKSSAGVFGAKQVVEKAAHLENIGHSADLSAADEALIELESAVSLMIDAVSNAATNPAAL